MHLEMTCYTMKESGFFMTLSMHLTVSQELKSKAEYVTSYENEIIEGFVRFFHINRMR